MEQKKHALKKIKKSAILQADLNEQTKSVIFGN